MTLKEIIEAGESEITEFKTSLAEWRDVVETVSAFSNRNGGRVFIGVSDDCDIIGVDIGRNTIEKLANQIKQNTDPVIYPSIRVNEMFWLSFAPEFPDLARIHVRADRLQVSWRHASASGSPT